MIPINPEKGPVMEYPYDEVYPKAYEKTGEGTVRFHLYFPNAKEVKLRTYTGEFTLDGENGHWFKECEVGTGFIVLFIIVDGNDTLYPVLPIGFGGNRPINYIELEEDDITEPTDCKHGTVAVDYFKSLVTNRLERIYVYLPPDYHEEPDKKYPTLYLQHGHGENETAWVNQGKVNFIMDKLIAEQKAQPMILVMCNGMVSYERKDGIFVKPADQFEEFLTTEVIPYAEKRYRALGNKENRAMAGLSMGSMQTSVVTLKHQDLFDYVGIFSGFVQDFLSGYEEHTTEKYLRTYAQNIKYIFRAMGKEDIFLDYFKKDDELLKRYHVTHERVIYDGAHEWKVWQRCIYDFAQKIFPESEKKKQSTLRR